VTDKVTEALKPIAEVKIRPEIKDIETLVFNKLCDHGHKFTAKSYESYRAVREFQRKTNTIDKDIRTLLAGDNEELSKENANKNAELLPTKRDYMASIVSEDDMRRTLPKHLMAAHDKGSVYFHDLGYVANQMTNCELTNLKDILDNGTVINKRKINSPKSFQVACTLSSQVIAQVSAHTFGGQSINIKHLGKYLKKSYDRYMSKISNKGEAYELFLDELKAGVQTLQYQILTIMSTNGQFPFITFFLELDEKDEYLEWTAMIVEEILKQRKDGLEDENGIITFPAFPKLIMPVDSWHFDGGRFEYITKLAAECIASSMFPDIISSKKMREVYEGNVFSPIK
jgi:ribonucleoside-triphosphate reductase